MKLKKMAKRVLALALTSALVITGAAINSNGASAAKKVTLKLNKKKATVNVGKKVTLKVTKKNVKSAKITWKTSKKAVATVSKKGVVTGKKAGKATISAKITYKAKGSNKSKKKTLKCAVTVTAKNPTASEDKAPGTGTSAPNASAAPGATASQAPTKSGDPAGTGTPAPGANNTDAPKSTGTPAPDADGTDAPADTDTPAPDADSTDAPADTDTPAPDADSTDAPADTGTPTPDADSTDAPAGTPDADSTDAPAGTGTPAPEGTETPESSEEPVESVTKGAQYSVTCRATLEPPSSDEGESEVVNPSISRDEKVDETRGIDKAVKFDTYKNGTEQPGLIIDCSELDITGMKTPTLNISIANYVYLNLMHADNIESDWSWTNKTSNAFSLDPSMGDAYAIYLNGVDDSGKKVEKEIEITVTLLDAADLPVVATKNLAYTGTWKVGTKTELPLEFTESEYYELGWSQVDIYTDDGYPPTFECHSYNQNELTFSYEDGKLSFTPGEGKEYTGEKDLIIEYRRDYTNDAGQTYSLTTRLTLQIQKEE